MCCWCKIPEQSVSPFIDPVQVRISKHVDSHIILYYFLLICPFICGDAFQPQQQSSTLGGISRHHPLSSVKQWWEPAFLNRSRFGRGGQKSLIMSLHFLPVNEEQLFGAWEAGEGREGGDWGLHVFQSSPLPCRLNLARSSYNEFVPYWFFMSTVALKT